jgi:hypothetical protein
MARKLNFFSQSEVMKKTLIWLGVILMSVVHAFGQDHKGTFMPFVVQGTDTFPVYQTSEVRYAYILSPDDKIRQQQMAKLVRDLRIVMPYARTCSMKMQEINDAMATLPKSERKRYLHQEEAKLKTEFEDKLKDLNVRQGKLLIKLIDRETGHSSYALIREYKNGVTAFFWNGFASLFGMSLKEKYDRNKEKTIEYAIQSLGY